MSDTPSQRPDPIQERIGLILESNLPHEEKMRLLGELEPLVEAAYASGLTQVKPVSQMGPDDLDLDL